MVDTAPCIAKLIEVVQATWPDVASNGVFEAEHIDLVPWEELPPPYAIISIDEEMPAAESPLGQIWYRPDIRVFRVDMVRGMNNGIIGKLRTLGAALWPNVPGALDPLASAGVGQIITMPRMSWSRKLEPNTAFQKHAVNRRGGSLTLSVLLAEPE